MALINCFECNQQVSDSAAACPQCGAPVSQKSSSAGKSEGEPYSQQEVALLLSKKKKTSHILHLILSIITAGFWILIWVIVAISNSTENARIDSKIKKGKK